MNKYNVRIVFEVSNVKAKKIANSISTVLKQIKKGKISSTICEAMKVKDEN